MQQQQQQQQQKAKLTSNTNHIASREVASHKETDLRVCKQFIWRPNGGKIMMMTRDFEYIYKQQQCTVCLFLRHFPLFLPSFFTLAFVGVWLTKQQHCFSINAAIVFRLVVMRRTHTEGTQRGDDEIINMLLMYIHIHILSCCSSFCCCCCLPCFCHALA